MKARNMFVDIYVRAVINCLVPYISRFVYRPTTLFAAYIVSHRIISPHEHQYYLPLHFMQVTINRLLLLRPFSYIYDVVAPSSHCQGCVDLVFFSLYYCLPGVSLYDTIYTSQLFSHRSVSTHFHVHICGAR